MVNLENTESTTRSGLIQDGRGPGMYKPSEGNAMDFESPRVKAQIRISDGQSPDVDNPEK
jgi:hypothetical protein